MLMSYFYRFIKSESIISWRNQNNQGFCIVEACIWTGDGDFTGMVAMIGPEYCSVSPIWTRYALHPTPQRDYKLESYCSYNSASLNLCPLFILFTSSSPLSFVDLLIFNLCTQQQTAVLIGFGCVPSVK